MANAPGGPPPFGNPDRFGAPYPPAQPPASASGRAIASLVCGIVAWAMCGCLTAIPAIILGWMEMKDIEAGIAPNQGMTFAKVGFWLGVVNAALYLLIFLIYIVVFVIFGVSTALFSV